MKHIIASLILAVAVTAVASGQTPRPLISAKDKAAMSRASEYRTFIVSDGTKFKARLTGFSASAETVKLKMADGSKRMAKLPTFSAEDQAAIQDWHVAYSLLKRKKLCVTTKERETEDLLYHGRLDKWTSMFPNMGYEDQWHSCHPGTTYDEISYGINVENKSGESVSNIRVEYCIYHQTTINEIFKETVFREGGEMSGWWPRSAGERLPEKTVLNTIRGTFHFRNISNREELAETTDSMKLVDHASEIKSEHTNCPEPGDRGTRNIREIEGELLGIRYRVYLPTPAGHMAMMEFSDPKNLINQTEWVAP